MTYLLDTNVCIALMKEWRSPVRDHYERARGDRALFFVPSVVVFELWFGAGKSDRVEANSGRLRGFLSGEITELPLDSDDARAAGLLRAELERAGRPIGPYDLLIAGQAINRKLTLVTANESEFARVKGLRTVNWARG